KDGKYTEPKLPTGVYADLRILMNLRADAKITSECDRGTGKYGRMAQNFSSRIAILPYDCGLNSLLAKMGARKLWIRLARRLFCG
ncbi:hypothetical protein LLE49_28175, partial [Alicyclobacillus tolerans]|nr:hypothetical protein [Alicyclobacillus tolerans]